MNRQDTVSKCKMVMIIFLPFCRTRFFVCSEGVHSAQNEKREDAESHESRHAAPKNRSNNTEDESGSRVTCEGPFKRANELEKGHKVLNCQLFFLLLLIDGVG